MGPLTYVVLKAVTSLMANLIVVSNREFVMLLCILNVSFFTDFARLDLTQKHLIRKLLS